MRQSLRRHVKKYYSQLNLIITTRNQFMSRS